MIDFATRSGGWRDIMLYHAGIDYNTLILKSYLEDYFTIDDKAFTGRYSVGAGILLYSTDINKLEIARKSSSLCEEYLLGNLPKQQPLSLADAYGYYFLKAPTKEELKGLLPVY